MSDISRRTFLWVTGGSSIALVTAQPRKAVNKLIPKVIPPEEIRPGSWILFATTCRECPAGCGMHVSHRDGRVTKVEGNPSHPVNRGGLCARGQSAPQGLYDPDRLRKVLYRAKGHEPQARSWQEAFSAISAALSAGGRVTVLSRVETGSLAGVMTAFAAAFGSNRVIFYEPFGYQALKAAHKQLFGLPVIPRYDLEGSDFILSFSADFLETWVSPVSYALQFSNMHSYREAGAMGRMAYVGPRLSMTASNADTFVQVPPGQERVVAASLLKIIADRGWAKNDISPYRGAIDALIGNAAAPAVAPEVLEALARSLVSARAPVVLAGPEAAGGVMATETALCAALLNMAAGSIGKTVDLSRPHALSGAAGDAELDAFFASLGPRDIVFVHETNPSFSRVGSAEQLARAGMVVCLGTMMDETAQQAQWVLPLDSPLESWGDYQPEPGIRGVMQPTMGRLYDTRGAGEVFLTLARQMGRPLAMGRGWAQPADFAEWVKRNWSRNGTEEGDGKAWTALLQAGGVWGAAPKPAPGSSPSGRPTALRFTQFPVQQPENDAAELWPWGSIMLYDGRLANRGWLQEAPDPISFIVWGNWIDMHPAKAKALGIDDGDEIQLTTLSGSVRAPVRITPEVSEHTVAIGLGQGHTALGRNAAGTGVNAFVLLGRRQEGSMFTTCRISKVPGIAAATLIRTAPTKEQLDRDLLRSVPLSHLGGMRPGEEGEKLHIPLPEGYDQDRNLYPAHPHGKHRWGMVIDLQRCIGCGACSVACYAENNISVVGRDHVGKGREMAWLRVPPYRKEGKGMSYGWLPLHCQHCDAAPCEPVCPVYAAVHNEEGLNAQIYNRCIGTRYCSNNCPYKVRRFNWINIDWRPPLDMQLNPEVTVRTRGVMEKCTFCVQRIRQAEYQASRERRAVADGEIVPACAQTCPAKVFTFGDLLDPNSQVSRVMRSDPRRYQLLDELNTKPAVIFLKRVDPDA